MVILWLSFFTSLIFQRVIHEHISILHSFLLWNNIPLCGYTTVCWLIQQMIDVWVSTFWQLETILLWMFVYTFFVDVFTSLEYIGSGITGPYCNSMTNNLWKCQTFPKWLYCFTFLSKYIRIPFSTHPNVLLSVFLIIFFHSSEEVSHCGFDLHLSNE